MPLHVKPCVTNDHITLLICNFTAPNAQALVKQLVTVCIILFVIEAYGSCSVPHIMQPLRIQQDRVWTIAHHFNLSAKYLYLLS